MRLPELRRNIYVIGLDGTHVVADHPDDECEMPWYVVLTLGAFSKKHAFAPSKTLSAGDLRERLIDFSNRVKWTVSVGSNRQLPLLKRRAGSCNEVVPAAVNAFIAAARNVQARSKEVERSAL